MTQYIDISYREKATSTAINKRFRDVTGPTVLSGFRLGLGSEAFSISLLKGGYTSSVAITPSGTRVEEDQDIFDAVYIQPNDLNEGNPRVDSIYLVYQFGAEDALATYTVVPGTGGTSTPNPNPNANTHLLLGYVNVPPMGAAPTAADLTSAPIGIHTLEVAYNATFFGSSTFKDEVVFEKPVRFLDGTLGAEDPNSSFREQLTYPIVATPGQQEFTVPSPGYSPRTNTLQVYVDWLPQPPSMYDENSPTTFKFHDPLKGGEKVWFTWFRNIALYTPEQHEHDNLYYRKNEVNNRSLHHSEDYFAGSNGRVITHYLGTTNYVVMTPTTTEKAVDVGEITIEKRADEFIVYNSGSYRGKFDVSYYLKQSYQYTPNSEDIGFFDIKSAVWDDVAKVYKEVSYKRADGTLYLMTTLDNFDARGYYRRMKLEFYNSTGTAVVQTRWYALDYDANKLVYSKVLIPE